MLIRKIEVRNFKCLSGPLVFEGFDTGINVIAGDNEEGKSTLMQAIKAVVFQQHNSSSQLIKDFRPYNSSLRPEVTLELELAGQNYSIRKMFCSKQSAEFRSPAGVFEGSEAEEKIRELFALPDLDKSGKRTAQVDSGIWGLLWLDQGTAEEGLRTSAGGKESWMRVLESDISSVNAGQRGRSLLRNIEKQADKFYSLKGDGERERVGLKRVAEAVDEKQKELDACLERYSLYESKLLKLQETQETLAENERSKTLERAQLAIDKANEDFNALALLKVSLDAASEAERSASMQFEQTKKQSDDLGRLKSRKEDCARKLAELSSALGQIQIQIKEQEGKISSATEKKESADKAHSDLEKRCERAEQREKLATLKKQINDLRSKLRIIEDLETKQTEAKQQQEEIKATEQILGQLRKLNKEMMSAELRCDSAATKITLRPLPDQMASIEGKEVSKETDLSFTKPTEIKLKGWGEIHVLPGGEETEELDKTLASIRNIFQETLAESACSNLDEAEEQLRRRKELDMIIDGVKKDIVNLGNPDSINKELSALESEFQSKSIAEESSTPSSTLHTLPVDHMRSAGLEPGSAGVPPASEALFESLKAELKTAKSTLLAADSLLKSEQASLSKLSTEFNKLQLELTSCQSTLKSSEQSLHELSSISEESLQEQLKDTTQKLNDAKQKAQNIRTELSKLKESELQEKLEEAKRKYRQVDLLVKSLNAEKITLSTEINTEGQSGLGETIEKLKGELQLAQKKLLQVTRHAQALQLLCKSLQEAEAQSKEQIFEPVFTLMRPHLQELFPGAELAIDQSSFDISEVRRNGQSESYKSLSTGTREQLSVLTRVAVAKLLKQQGQPSVILLDDALVYSDDQRFARMKEILKEVSADIQVIILTCRLRDYSDIPQSKIIQFPQAVTAAKR